MVGWLLGAWWALAVTPTAWVDDGAPATTNAPVAPLERELRRLAQSAGGTVGLSILHLERRVALSLHGDQRFPMASTVKVPIAIECLRQVQAGTLSMDADVHVTRGDLHPGSGDLTRSFGHEPRSLTLASLLEPMMLISDNSATDLVLHTVGGPRRVQDRMQAWGVDLRIDRSTLALIADWLGVGALPDERHVTPEQFQELYQRVSADDRRAAAEAFRKDPRDTSTPDAMTHLLAALWRGELLDEPRRAWLLDVMARCETGVQRLPGRLPPETRVYHKTGTIGGSTNDVGIIALPEPLGHVVISAFVRDSVEPIAVRERAIADLARAVHDYFVFLPSDAP